jgi:hypothetical protein
VHLAALATITLNVSGLMSLEVRPDAWSYLDERSGVDQW